MKAEFEQQSAAHFSISGHVGNVKETPGSLQSCNKLWLDSEEVKTLVPSYISNTPVVAEPVATARAAQDCVAAQIFLFFLNVPQSRG